ncbi:phage baseplate protein [Yersinia enterocolitica]
MDILSALFRQQTRKIGLLVPSVIISEKHQDALEITEHPVEVGAAVNDHAYKRASEVTMEVGFAGGGSLLDFVDTSTIGLSLGKSPEEVYQELRELQESRQPFDVITGKRKYSNMLIRGIEVTTDKTSENVLMCVLTLCEVIMSQTESIKVADKENMQEGVSTSAMQNTGTKAPAPANNSLLKSGLDWVTENFK